MNLAEAAVRGRLVVAILIAGVLFGGWYAYRDLPRLEDPEFLIRTAVVATPYPGATAEEVADEVTEVLETAIQNLHEVEEVRSVSSIGSSVINVDVRYEYSRNSAELNAVWTKLRNRIGDVRGRLPPGAAAPVVNDDFGEVYGLLYLITGEGYTPRELHAYAKALRKQLLAVPDVGRVAVLGARDEAIYVEVSRERAAALGVAVERIYADLAAENSVAPAGSVRVGDRRVAILPSASIDSVADLESTLVTSEAAGAPVRLGDVATVRRSYAEPPGMLVRFDGRPALALGVANVSGANVVEMGSAIDRMIDATQADRPIGIEVDEFYHQGKVVDAAVANFVANVALALGIVLVTLCLFMGIRSAVMIGAVLLLTVAATLTTMYVFGIPMHRISLGALIIALGMLVDNAIVVGDGMLVGIAEGRPRRDVARDVFSRTKWPLLGGTVVGILAFAPIGLAPGNVAEYARDLFWVVMISLLFSWLFAMIVVPLLSDLLFRDGQPSRSRGAGEDAVLRGYRALLRLTLSRRWIAVGVAVSLFAASVIGFAYVKAGFFAASTTPQVVVDYWLAAGTDIARTIDDMISLEGEVAALEGVEAVQTLIGAGGLRHMLVYAPEAPNPSYGQILARLDDHTRIDELLPRIQGMVDAGYPDARAKVWRFQLGPGGGSKIEARFSGPDPDVLLRLAGDAKAAMAAHGGAVSMKDDWRGAVPVIQPEFARRAAVCRASAARISPGRWKRASRAVGSACSGTATR